MSLFYITANMVSTKEMAHLIANGVESTGIAVKIRTVPNLATVVTEAAASIPAEGDIYYAFGGFTVLFGFGFRFTNAVWQYGIRNRNIFGIRPPVYG